MLDHNVIFTRRIGNVLVQARYEHDWDGQDEIREDYSVTFLSRSSDVDWKQHVYDRKSGATWHPSAKHPYSDNNWRDSRGRFLSSSEIPDITDWRYARDTPAFMIKFESYDPLKWRKHAIESVEAWLNDQWYYCGIVVEIFRVTGDIDDELASASLWGIRSDEIEDYDLRNSRYGRKSDDQRSNIMYIREIIFGLVRQATAEART